MTAWEKARRIAADCNGRRGVKPSLTHVHYAGMMRRTHRHGFTLIELSIVLVIIGLLVGGVLVGRDLIRASELRSITTQVEQVATGVNTFRLKYNALPGDMANATGFWGADAGCPNTAYNAVAKAATCNGNGDRAITGIYDPKTCGFPSVVADYHEMIRFWQHLANAGLIAGQYSGAGGPNAFYDTAIGINVPQTKLNNIGIQMIGTTNCVLAGQSYFAGATPFGHRFDVGAPITSNGNPGPFLRPLEAYNIDTKQDDGLPSTGKIRTAAPDWAYAVDCASTAVASTATYLTTQSGRNCQLIFANAF
jgi:prepilin-type N-terminal cleavage/methylation domain-containing protein